MNANDAALLGFLIALPLMMALIGTACTGIVLSLMVRRVRLLLLSAMTAWFAFVLFSLDTWDHLDSFYMDVPAIKYGLWVTGITAHWFWSVRNQRGLSKA